MCVTRKNVLFFLSLCYFSYLISAYRTKTVIQKIETEERFSIFNALLRNCSLARRAIQDWNTTVFVPTNEAFKKFKGVLSEDLVYYHVSIQLKSLSMVFESRSLKTLLEGYPPLWVSKIDSGLFINNAKIDDRLSDIFSKASGSYYNNYQAMHVIDDVLEPPNKNLNNPSALDIIKNFTRQRHISTKKYLDRIEGLKLMKLFEITTASTFFVPVDSGVDDYRYRTIDRYVVEGHIIPNQVLFTRPTIKNTYINTRANGDYIFILASFVVKNEVLYVRSNTVFGDTNHEKGELWSRVVKANVPVRNGVVHFIEKPLAIFDFHLNPFPFLPILTKLAADPDLNTTFYLGEKTGFNDYLKIRKNTLFTYFVPRDKAWVGVLSNLSDVGSQTKLLGRHLVISDVRYTMEKLWYRTFNRVVTMNTVSGAVDIELMKDNDGQYYILYNNKRIKVFRPDYICTNGVIHIIDEPFFDYRRKGELKMDFWKSVQDFVL